MRPDGAEVMCDQWMPALEYPLTAEQFHQLPRNPAYKYEYLGHRALLSPRPRHYHARLRLRPPADDADPVGPVAAAAVRPARAGDWPALEKPFCGAFHRVQPFASLDEATMEQAARQCLGRVQTGGDGPWIESASFIAEQEGHAVGALLVTLLPAGDSCDWDSYYWREPPPADAVAKRLGRPHLTWIFVAPWHTGHGLGTRLLNRAVRALLGLGYDELLSTFLVGNDSSMLWHWRSGFELLAHPGSVRSMHERWRRHAQ